MRVLALDPGERRVGIAVSDPNGSIAVPVGVYLRRGKDDGSELAAVAQREAAELIVVGLPISLDGTEGPQALLARRFGATIAAESCLPVVFWDERYSTKEATRLAIEAGGSRRKRKAGIDARAATVMLQDYLDCHRAPASLDESLNTD
jgi:putative Holliday junction resolvase